MEREYLESYKGSQGSVTLKAKELWVLRELAPGDLIVANKGTKEVLGVGAVESPGYEWPLWRNQLGPRLPSPPSTASEPSRAPGSVPMVGGV